MRSGNSVESRRPGRRRSSSAPIVPAAGLDQPRLRPPATARAAQERHAVRLAPARRRAAGSPSRIRPAARAGSTARRRGRPGAARQPRRRSPAVSSRQPSPISVASEGLEHGHGLRPARGDQQAAVHDRDAGLRRDLGPDVARALARAPALAALLAGDGDEAEIADRGAVRLRVAVDHHHALAAPARPPAHAPGRRCRRRRRRDRSCRSSNRPFRAVGRMRPRRHARPAYDPRKAEPS